MTKLIDLLNLTNNILLVTLRLCDYKSWYIVLIVVSYYIKHIVWEKYVAYNIVKCVIEIKNTYYTN